MGEIEQVPLELIGAFERARLKSYMRLCAGALLTYDVLLTIGPEVNHIWPSKFSAMKLLYFYTRYAAFIDVIMVLYYCLKPDITPAECKTIYLIASWFIVAGIIVAESILMVRTWAIWQRSKRMAAILIGISTAAIIAACLIEGLYLKTLMFASFASPETPGCLLIGGNSTIGINFVIIIIAETAVLILTLTGGFQRFRAAGRSRQDLASILYRDGILFYVYLFGISLLSFIIILTFPAYGGDLLTGLQRVLHSCLSARVLLNLRAASSTAQTTGMSLPTVGQQHQTTLYFAGDPGSSVDSSNSSNDDTTRSSP